MKKIIFTLLIAIVLPLSAGAYSPYMGYPDITVDVTARGGYNFAEKSPLAGGVLGLNFMGFRGELEVGWTYFNSYPDSIKENFCYVSPMVGYVYGFQHQAYAMIGITNWGYYETTDDPQYSHFRSDILYGKVKIGCNLFLSQRMFINMDLSYLLPRHFDYHYLTYDGIGLKVGIGFRF